MKLNSIVCLAMTCFFFSCAGNQISPNKTDPTNTYETYNRIQATLETAGDTIDYDTLMNIYNSIVQSQHRIPHADRLLKSLIYKRNENPRVDQMILIFSAMALGKSKFPVSDAYGIFESILKMNDQRLNEWVISFVGAAIGEYAFDIPEGDRLVDLLEKRLDQIQTSPAGSREYYGYHFLPPPRTESIRAYIAGIQEQRTRETERRNYYSLILNGINEIEIETALKRIQSHANMGTGKISHLPMEYMLINMDRLFSDTHKGAQIPDSNSND